MLGQSPGLINRLASVLQGRIEPTYLCAFVVEFSGVVLAAAPAVRITDADYEGRPQFKVAP
jgi:hypothetical protein